MAKGAPTSIRLPDDVEKFVNTLTETLKASNLEIESTRNGVICMILRSTMNRGGNAIFNIVFENVQHPNKVDAHTVRGISNEVSKKDISDTHFNNFLTEAVL